MLPVPKPIAERVKRRRDALCKAGLRPFQIWAPDTRRPGFAAGCRRQSALVAEMNRHDTGLSEFLDAALADIFKATGPR
jgi:hypothetical protein